MSHHSILLSGPRRTSRTLRLFGGVLLLCAALGGAGCSVGPQGTAADQLPEPAREAVSAAPLGTLPVRLDFLYVFENVQEAPYYPIEGIGGLEYAPDGTLFFCDEKGGRVYGLEPGQDEWYLFDSSPSRPFRPIDIRVDGFSVLVLDIGGRLLLRYDMNGVFQDRLLSFSHLDPVIQRLPTAFDVDMDGRLIVTDASEQQVLMLDSFLTLTQVLGEPGSHREQFTDPSGIVFLPNGGFVVADRANRRLQLYNRLGYFERIIGGEFELDNPLLTPQGLDCDAYGNLFVADPASGTVHVFSRRLSRLFSIGWDDGLLAAPEIPIDVAAGPNDLLAVADRGKQAILVYKIVYE